MTKIIRESIPRLRNFQTLIWIMFVVFIVYLGFNLAIFWPGVFDNDSLDQWTQIATDTYTNYHPFIHTLLMVPFGKLDMPEGFAVLQTVAFIGAFWYAVTTFRSRLNSFGVFVIFLAIITNPAIGISLATFWKDTLYSIAVAVTGLILVNIYNYGKDGAFRPKQFVMLTVIFYLLATIRHNGIFALVVVTIIIFFLKSKTAQYACLMSLVFALLTPQVLRMANIQSDPVPFGNYAALHTLIGYARQHPGDTDVMTFVLRYVPPDKLAQYNPEGANWLILNRGPNHTAIRSGTSELYFKLLSVARRDPIYIASIVMERAQIGIFILTNPNIGIYHYQLPSVNPRYPLAFQNTSLFQWYQGLLKRAIRVRPVRFFWSPALLLIINLIIVLFVPKRKEILLLLTPSLASYFSVIGVLPAQDYRYFLYLLFVTPISLGVFISALAFRAERKT